MAGESLDHRPSLRMDDVAAYTRSPNRARADGLDGSVLASGFT